MQKNKVLIFSFLILAVVLNSCKGEDIYYQQFTEIENQSWDMKETKSFDFEIEDTTKLYDFFFNLRNTNDYPYANIFVFWKLESPDGKTKTDTAQFILARPNGKWLGKTASGTVIENSMWFLRTKLPVRGLYSFNFTQGMRDKELLEVKDVGLKIIKRNE